jgi:ABC-2 type transport system ATP-binding protein
MDASLGPLYRGRMAAVSVREVEKRFGPVTALDRVSFDVAPGEVVALLGANGAGKTTLLRILGTTVICDAGDAVVAGHSVTKEPASVRASIGFLLPEERSWYWRLTGRHNLEFFAALYGVPRKERRRHVERLLDEIGLLHAADRSFGGYSSGMRLRLSLARALLPEPPVMLLDEPTRSLDPVATKHFHDLMLQIAEQRNTAILVATHDLHEAVAVASRVLILTEGVLSEAADGWTNTAELEDMLLAAGE